MCFIIIAACEEFKRVGTKGPRPKGQLLSSARVAASEAEGPGSPLRESLRMQDFFGSRKAFSCEVRTPCRTYTVPYTFTHQYIFIYKIVVNILYTYIYIYHYTIFINTCMLERCTSTTIIFYY